MPCLPELPHSLSFKGKNKSLPLAQTFCSKQTVWLTDVCCSLFELCINPCPRCSPMHAPYFPYIPTKGLPVPAQSSEAAWQHSLGTTDAPRCHCTATERPRAAQGQQTSPLLPTSCLLQLNPALTSLSRLVRRLCVTHWICQGRGWYTRYGRGSSWNRLVPSWMERGFAAGQRTGEKRMSNRKSCSCVHINTDHTLANSGDAQLVILAPLMGNSHWVFSQVLVPQCTASMGLTAHENACCPLLLLHLTSCLPSEMTTGSQAAGQEGKIQRQQIVLLSS